MGMGFGVGTVVRMLFPSLAQSSPSKNLQVDLLKGFALGWDTMSVRSCLGQTREPGKAELPRPA